MTLILKFEFSAGELEEFESEHGGDLSEWLFGELCQNHGFGFLVGIERRESAK